MRVKHWLLMLLGAITVTAFAGGPTPTAPPAASPPPTATPSLPALMGTPMPLPAEPITPDNVDRLQLLAVWGRGAAQHAAFSPDGQTLAIGTTAGVWLHDAKTRALRRFMPTDEEVTALAFLADGQLMAQVGGKTINRWDVTTGALAGSWSLDTERNSIDLAAFAPDGTRVAASLGPGTRQVGLWGMPGGRLLSVLDSRRPGSERVLSSLAFSPDGSRLACAMALTSKTPNNVVEVRDVKTGALMRTLLLPDQGELSNVVFSADGKLVAAANDRDIFVWQAETGELLHTLTGHTSMLSLAFSPDGAQLASASYDKTVRLWSVAEGRLLHTLVGGEVVTSMKDLSFSPDGTTLVSVGVKSVVNLWDTATGALLGEVEGYADGIADLAVAADGTLYTAHPNHLGVRQWNIQTGQITRRFPGQTKWGTKLAVSANGQILAASQYDPYPSVLIWNATTGQHLPTLKEYNQSVGSLALSPDGSLAASSEETLIIINETKTGQQVYRLSGGKRPDMVSNLAFSTDGLKLVSGGEFCQITVFAVKTGKQLFTLGEGVPAFSPDGTIIATGDTEGQISLWSSVSGEKLRLLAQQKSRVTGLTFSADGRLLASGSVDQTIHLWEAETGRLLRVLEKGSFAEGVPFFSPDDTMLFSNSFRDGTIRFWGLPPQ